MRAYVAAADQDCHRRGAHAMGGMAAQIPIKNDPAANEAALAKVRADKQREVERRPRRHLGGAPGPGARRAGGVRRAHDDAEPDRTSARRRAGHCRRICWRFRRARSPRPACARTSTSAFSIWKRGCGGNGCVPLYNLMEDAATAEISRAQIWQWIHHRRGARRRPEGHAEALPRT